jgi:hypothetical protein
MNLAHLFTQTVVYAPPTGISVAGDPTFGAQVSIKARVEFGTKLVYGGDGTELQSEAQFSSEVEVPMGSRVWLPGDDTDDVTAARRIIAKKKCATFGGYSYAETYL